MGVHKWKRSTDSSLHLLLSLHFGTSTHKNFNTPSKFFHFIFNKFCGISVYFWSGMFLSCMVTHSNCDCVSSHFKYLLDFKTQLTVDFCIFEVQRLFRGFCFFFEFLTIDGDLFELSLVFTFIMIITTNYDCGFQNSFY